MFAWKADGTAYVGTVGTDGQALATLVDGAYRMTATDDVVGFLEGSVFRNA